MTETPKLTKAQKAALLALVNTGQLIRARSSKGNDGAVANRTAGFLLANGYATEAASDLGRYLVPTQAARDAVAAISGQQTLPV